MLHKRYYSLVNKVLVNNEGLLSRLRISKVSKRYIGFQDLNLDNNIVRNLRKYDIRNPTDIQIKAIQYLCTGKSAIIKSETGSGKTLAYAIPIAQMILSMKMWQPTNLPKPFALILVPNLELGYQVHNVLTSMLLSRVCIASEVSPLKLINTDVAIATPQYLYTYPLSILNEVQTVVLDEADLQIARKIGKHGKKDPLFNIMWYLLERENFSKLEFNEEKEQLMEMNANEHNSVILKDDEFQMENRQFIFVGATMPDSVNKKSKSAIPYIRSWLPDIEILQTDNAHKVLPASNMTFIDVLKGNKTKLLLQCLHDLKKQSSKPLRILVFVNTLKTITELYEELNKTSIVPLDSLGNKDDFLDIAFDFSKEWKGKIYSLHKNIPFFERLETLSNVASTDQSLLITTDVTSRGIDIPDVDLVIQYDFATNIVDVLHRAGRTARMQKEGKVINFITENDEYLANAVKNAMKENVALDSYFSRNRGLRRRIREEEARAEKSDNETEN